jgi:hypothetical protein
MQTGYSNIVSGNTGNDPSNDEQPWPLGDIYVAFESPVSIDVNVPALSSGDLSAAISISIERSLTPSFAVVAETVVLERGINYLNASTEAGYQFSSLDENSTYFFRAYADV